jgi:crossover junction endodeoxyribonuclease RuvC
VGTGIEELLDEYRPAAVAIERVFAQQNVRTVMGVAQISGVALLAAARRELPVALHTPSEVKLAITGFGSADKRQVQAMVARILGLAETPKPADAADALAIAICHAWRQPIGSAGPTGELTPAQQAWRAAEKQARTPAPRRLTT